MWIKPNEFCISSYIHTIFLVNFYTEFEGPFLIQHVRASIHPRSTIGDSGGVLQEPSQDGLLSNLKEGL